MPMVETRGRGRGGCSHSSVVLLLVEAFVFDLISSMKAPGGSHLVIGTRTIRVTPVVQDITPGRSNRSIRYLNVNRYHVTNLANVYAIRM
jgi:hypothetical protein